MKCLHPSYVIVRIPQKYLIESQYGETYELRCWGCGEELPFSIMDIAEWETRENEIDKEAIK